MYVQYSGGQLPYYAQPAQYQPQYQPAYAGAVSPQPVQSVMQMPQMPQMQQYPATYSGFSGGAYMASPAYGQPQLAQYGQPQPQAQPQPQYAQLQYQPQVQPQVQPLQSGMAEGAYGQVIQPAGQQAYISHGYAKPGEVQMPQMGAQRVGTNLTQVTGPDAEEDDDPNRLPTFVKVRGLPAEHDPRIARRPRPKKRAPGICCA